MLNEIFSHTPLYVWAILAFLVYRGLQASKTHEVKIATLCVIPLVMLGLSLFGIQTAFGLAGLAPLLWLAGAVAGAALGWRISSPASLHPHPERGTLTHSGSWIPMIVMMSLFCMKYAVAVLMAMSPALRHEPGFITTICALYGVFSGIFMGRLLRIVLLYRQARAEHDALRTV